MTKQPFSKTNMMILQQSFLFILCVGTCLVSLVMMGLPFIGIVFSIWLSFYLSKCISEWTTFELQSQQTDTEQAVHVEEE